MLRRIATCIACAAAAVLLFPNAADAQVRVIPRAHWEWRGWPDPAPQFEHSVEYARDWTEACGFAAVTVTASPEFVTGHGNGTNACSWADVRNQEVAEVSLIEHWDYRGDLDGEVEGWIQFTGNGLVDLENGPCAAASVGYIEYSSNSGTGGPSRGACVLEGSAGRTANDPFGEIALEVLGTTVYVKMAEGEGEHRDECDDQIVEDTCRDTFFFKLRARSETYVWVDGSWATTFPTAFASMQIRAAGQILLIERECED